uniref:DUF7935 family protein n=1 Tax=Flavobacterium sp. TaxID=239 RepID=UPI0040490254
MDWIKIIELAAYVLPALVTGLVAYYYFKLHTENLEKERRFLLAKENQKEALPLKLQAYERMALFLERINPTKLLIRVTPYSSDKNDYEAHLIQNIEQEFEHNLTQQIYISEDCWTIISTAKSNIIQNIRKSNMGEKIDSAQKLRETILSDLIDRQPPTAIALNYLKTEVTMLLGN